MSEKYGSSDLVILHDLEPITTRPGMYIGSTDYLGTHHLAWEVIDNSVDEAVAGYGKNITVTIYKDGSLSVRDEGRGMPYDYNEQEKKDGFDIIFGTIHGGGKFSNKNYKTSAGLHGVGAACVNAFSEWVEITVYKNGKEVVGGYKNGGKEKIPVQVIGNTAKRGSFVRFKPKLGILTDVTWRHELFVEHLNNRASQLPGVHLFLVDEVKGTKDEFYYENGIVEFLERKNEKDKALTPVLHFKEEVDGNTIEFAIQYLDQVYEERLFSFANTIYTPDEGTHVSGFRKGFNRAINEYAQESGIIKKNAKIDNDDIKEGLSVIISVMIKESDLHFIGQTKGKLGTSAIQNPVNNFVYERVYYFLKENKSYAKAIMDKIMVAANARIKARKASEEVRTGVKPNDTKTQLLLSGKLVPPNSKDYSKCELFIVEGDSAGGSAKNCRDRRYQGLLPLRGKPKNISTDAEDAFMKNEELSTLTYTIGTGAGKDFNIKNLHYDKIIIMTDADTDGSHIQNLLLNFFYKKMRPLIENGHIYVACPPLYRVYKMVGRKTYEEFCWDEHDLEVARKKIGSGYIISRFKGLGEMDANQLWKTTMDPNTRRLIQIKMPDIESAGDKIELFMGKDASRRQVWINENIDFSNKDDFAVMLKNNQKGGE